MQGKLSLQNSYAFSFEGDVLVLADGLLDHSGGIIFGGESLQYATAASSGVSGVHHVVVFTQANPFTEDFTIFDSDDGDVIILAEGFNKLLVLGLVTAVGEQAEDGLVSIIDSLANFMKTLSQVVSEGSSLQDSSESTGQVQFLNQFLNVSIVNHELLSLL